MSIDAINNYYTQTTTSSSTATSNSNLTMDDFLQLLVAQLSNQDMYNTVDDSEFMAQMAQFSMVQALSDLNQASATSYNVSLIGKEVTVAAEDANGTVGTYTGLVTGVNLQNGSAQIIIDDMVFSASDILQVNAANVLDANTLTMVNRLGSLVDEVSEINDSLSEVLQSVGEVEEPEDAGESDETEGEGDV